MNNASHQPEDDDAGLLRCPDCDYPIFRATPASSYDAKRKNRKSKHVWLGIGFHTVGIGFGIAGVACFLAGIPLAVVFAGVFLVYVVIMTRRKK